MQEFVDKPWIGPAPMIRVLQEINTVRQLAGAPAMDAIEVQEREADVRARRRASQSGGWA